MVVFLGALTVLLDDVYELMEETECTDSDGDTVACTAGTSAVLASWQRGRLDSSGCAYPWRDRLWRGVHV